MDVKKLKLLSVKVTIVISLLILLFKLISYFLTNSTSVLATLMDSSLDILLSSLNFFVIYHAHRPPDNNHRYGHAKAEALGALVQVAFILGFAILLIYEILNRFINPTEIFLEPIAIILLILSTILVLLLVMFQNFIIKKTNSNIIKIDYLHYKTDFLLNIGVLVTLIASYYFQLALIDLIFATIVIFILLKGMKDIVKNSIAILMDQELPQKKRLKIANYVKSFSKCKGLHDLKTRSVGEHIFIEFHIELDPQLTLKAAHDISDEIEKALEKKFAPATVIIHQEPEGILDDRFNETL